MAKCATISTFTIDLCSNSLGGVKNVYLADYAEGAATYDKESGVVTALSGSWLKVPIRKNTASYTSTLNVSEESGNSVSTVLSLVFSKMETSKRMTMNALSLTDVMAVVEDANGQKVFLGIDNPVTLSAGTGETGTAKTDANRYTAELTDDSMEFPPFLGDKLSWKADPENANKGTWETTV